MDRRQTTPPQTCTSITATDSSSQDGTHIETINVGSIFLKPEESFSLGVLENNHNTEFVVKLKEIPGTETSHGERDSGTGSKCGSVGDSHESGNEPRFGTPDTQDSSKQVYRNKEASYAEDLPDGADFEAENYFEPPSCPYEEFNHTSTRPRITRTAQSEWKNRKELQQTPPR